MADLPTNLKDDILDSSVNTRRKYRMIENEDGTVEFEDVTEYSQVGDEYGAGLINETNKQVNAKVEKAVIVRDLKTIGAITEEGYIPDALALKDVNDSLGGVQFGKDGDGNYGYYGADGSLIPFKSRPTILNTYITRVGWRNAYIDITGLYSDYAQITIEDIAIQLTAGGFGGNSGSSIVDNINYSYDNNNGRITLTTSVDCFQRDAITCKVFIFKHSSGDLIEQTVTVRPSEVGWLTTTFTFDELEEVVALKSFAISENTGTAYFAITSNDFPITISGNTVTVKTQTYTTTANFTITVVGYAK